MPNSYPAQEAVHTHYNDGVNQHDSSEGPYAQGQGHESSCVVAAARTMIVNGDPLSPEDTISRADSASRKKAMYDEYEALMVNNTWTVTELPKGRKTIKCKWVYKTKRDASGNVGRHKAHVVVKGAFLQGELEVELLMEQPPCFEKTN